MGVFDFDESQQLLLAAGSNHGIPSAPIGQRCDRRKEREPAVSFRVLSPLTHGVLNYVRRSVSGNIANSLFFIFLATADRPSGWRTITSHTSNTKQSTGQQATTNKSTITEAPFFFQPTAACAYMQQYDTIMIIRIFKEVFFKYFCSCGRRCRW